MKQKHTPILGVLLAAAALAGCEESSIRSSGQPGARDVTVAARPDPVQAARGRAIYDRHCLECHGEAGKGRVLDWRIRDADGHFPPPPLNDTAHAWHHPTAVLLQMVRDGSPPGQGKMPAWKDRLSEQEMRDVVEYVKSLWTPPVYQLWMKMERQSLES